MLFHLGHKLKLSQFLGIIPGFIIVSDVVQLFNDSDINNCSIGLDWKKLYLISL